MERRRQNDIDPLYTSFLELKRMVGRTDGQKIPSPQTLYSTGAAPLFSHECGDTTITVYPNGFFIYQDGKRQTVYAVDRCRRLYYRYVNDEIRAIDEWQYADGPCLVPLLMTGDERLEHNLDSYEMYWREFTLGSTEDRWSQELSSPSAEDEVMREEDISQLQKGLDSLTARQKNIVYLYYEGKLSMERIAAILGIKKQSVFDNLNSAKKKLRKFKI